MSTPARAALAAGAARRLHLQQVRAAVRSQLAASARQRREELSHAIADLHHQLTQIRNDTRMRLREIALDAVARRDARKLIQKTQ